MASTRFYALTTKVLLFTIYPSFLCSELEEIRQNRFLSNDWPGEKDVQLRTKSADGLFIYVATACRFLKGSISPDERLPLLLQGDIGDGSPFHRLDLIYTHVLQVSVLKNCHERDKKERSDLFRRVIWSLVILADALPAPALSNLLGVQSRKTQNLLNFLHPF